LPTKKKLIHRLKKKTSPLPGLATGRNPAERGGGPPRRKKQMRRHGVKRLARTIWHIPLHGDQREGLGKKSTERTSFKPDHVRTKEGGGRGAI